MNFFVQQGYQRKIAETIVEILKGSDWSEARVAYSELADGSARWFRPKDTAGKVFRKSPVPAELWDEFSELRRAMADPSTGTWLSAEVFLTPDAEFAFKFNYDQRVYWGMNGPLGQHDADPEGHPSDEQYLEDLSLFPRDPGVLPEWYPSRQSVESKKLTAGSGAIAAVEEALSKSASLSSPLAGLDHVWGWPGVIESVRVGVEAVTRQAAEAGDLTPGVVDDGELARQLDAAIEFVFNHVYTEVLAALTVGQTQRLRSEAAEVLGSGAQPRQLDVAPDALARSDEFRRDPSVADLTGEIDRLVTDIARDLLGSLFGVMPDATGTVASR